VQPQAGADFHGVSLTWADDQADTYRIERNDGVVFNSTVNSFTDASARNGFIASAGPRRICIAVLKSAGLVIPR